MLDINYFGKRPKNIPSGFFSVNYNSLGLVERLVQLPSVLVVKYVGVELEDLDSGLGKPEVGSVN